MKQKIFTFCSRMMLTLACVLLPMFASADELTVNEGTTTNSYVPVYGNYFDYGFRSQFVIPASDLSEMEGGTITSMTFYSSDASSSWSGATYKITLLEVPSGTNLSSAFQSIDGGVEVFSGMQNIASNVMEIAFSSSFSYMGGDLLVETSSTGGGSYSSKSFYGKAVNGGARYASGSTSMTASGSSQTFSPKVTFEYDPAIAGSCDRPAMPVVSDITSAGATFVWPVLATVSQYQYAVVAKGAEVDWSVANFVSDTTVAISGLNANTQYDFYLRSYCGAGEGEQSSARKLSFRTNCGQEALPWSDNLDNVSTDCWVMPASGVTFETNSTYAYSGKAMKFATTSNVVVVLPYVGDLKGYRLRFYHRSEGTGTNATMGYIAAGYVTDPSDPSTFVAVEEVPHQYVGTFNDALFEDPAIPATAYAALRYHDATSSSWYAFVDELKIDPIPTCRPAKDLHLTDITASSASFAWTPANGETEWKLQCQNVLTGVTEVVNLSEPSFTLTDLPSGQYLTYTFIMKSVCGGETSVDSVVYNMNFATECEMVIPENDTIFFGAEGMTSLTPCYISQSTSSSYYWTTSTTAHSGSRSLYVTGATSSSSRVTLILPQVSIEENWQMSFYAKTVSQNVNNKLFVFINDSATLVGATPLDTITNMSNSEWMPYVMPLGERGDKFILIQAANYSGIYVDDIVLTAAPACQPVSLLTFEGFAAADGLFNASFSWTPGGAEDTWGYYYGIKVDTVGAEYEWPMGDADGYDFLPAEEMADPTHPVCIAEGLEPQTSYVLDLYILAGCDGGDNMSVATHKEFSFTTPCGAISAVDYVENFESYAVGSAAVDPVVDCWSFLGNNLGSSNYPSMYVNNSGQYVHAGDKSLYFVGSASTYAYAILPLFQEDLRDYRLKFYYSCESVTSSGKIYVGYMTNPNDESTFVQLEEIERKVKGSTPGAVHEALVSLSAIPAEVEGARIAIKYGGASNNYYMGIDDVTLEPLPSCVAISNLHVEDITSTSAKIAWNPGYMEDTWSVVIKNGSDTLFSDIVDVNYIEIDTLAPAHTYTYNVLVKAICGGEEAEDFLPAKDLTFTTECVAQALPYSENFNASSSLPVCMNFVLGVSGSTTYPYVTTSSYSVYEGNTLYFYGGTGYYGEELAVLPAFDREGLNGLLLKLVYKQSSVTEIYGGLQVGTMSDANDPSTFVLYRELPMLNVYTDAEVLLTNVPAGHRYIALRVPADYSSSTAYYVDDIVVEEAPSCFKPQDVHVEAVALTSVTYAWSGNAAQYEVLLNGQLHQVADTFYVHDGLQSSKNYVDSIKVRAICGEGDESEWTRLAGFAYATLCEDIVLPYSEDFESLLEGAPVCWNNEEGTASGSYRWAYYKESGTNNVCLRFNSYTSSDGVTNTLVTPAFVLTSEPAELVFDWKNPTGGDATLSISTDNGATKTTLLSSQLMAVSTWTTFTCDLTAYAGQTVNFYFSSVSNYGSGDAYHYLDNVRVREIPSCFPASNLHVVDSLCTETTVGFGWTPQNEDNLNAHVVVKSGSVVVVDSIVADSVFVIEGLQHSHTYNYTVSVYTVCGATESADALSATLLMKTSCLVITEFPYLEDFNSLAAGLLPACWDNEEGTTTNPEYRWRAYMWNTSDGDMCMRFNSYNNSTDLTNELATPEFLLGDDMEVSFWAKNPTGGSFNIYISADGGATKTIFETVPSGTTSWTFYEKSLAVYAGQTVQFFLNSVSNYGNGDAYHYFDDLKIRTTPSCKKPTDFHFGDISTDSCAILWSGMAEQYEVISLIGTTLDTTIVSDTMFVFRGLEPATTYTAQLVLRAICGEGEENKSDWVSLSAFTFTTDCLPVAALPWAADFEAAESSSMPVCWKKISDNTYPYVSSSSTSAHAGSKYLYAYAGSEYYGEEYIILPEFDETVNLSDAILSFYYKSGSTSSNYAQPVVGAMSDPTDASTFVALQTLELSSSYALAEVYLSNIPADYHYLAIYLPIATSSTSYYFDDFSVVAQPACKKVKNLAVEVLPTVANFSWESNGEENQWIVELFNGADRLDSVLVDAMAFSVDTLQPNTAYAFTLKVAAYCGEDGASEVVSKAFSFTTLPSCPMPTELEIASVTENEVVFAWTAGMDETAWLVQLYDAENALLDSVEVSSMSYAVNSLQPNTKYSYKLSVKAICGAEEMSEAALATFIFRTPAPAGWEVTLSAQDSLYVADFASAEETMKWITYGEGINQFTFGSDANALNAESEATVALYVSNDNATYAYTNNVYSSSVIYRQFELPATDSLLVEFDWMCAGGESSWDYGRAFFAPAEMSLEVVGSNPVAKLDGSQVAPGNSYASACPSGAFDLFGGKMNLKTGLQHTSTTLENLAGGVYNLIFVWGNDGSTGAQYPLSVLSAKLALLGATPAGPVTALDNLDANSQMVEKIIYNGQVYILRGGQIYSIVGQAVESIR